MSDTDEPTENEITDITDITDTDEITSGAEAEVADAPEPAEAEVEVDVPTEAADVAEVEAEVDVPTEAADVAEVEAEVDVPTEAADVAEVEAEVDAPTEAADVAEVEVDAPAEHGGVADVAQAEAAGPEPEVAGEVQPNGEAPADGDSEADVITEDELIEQPTVVDNPFTRPGRWFVVHTQSGYEKKVKQNLEARIHSMNAEEAVYEVVIPMEDYVDFKNGKRVVNQRKMFPGYLLVRAELDDTAWFVIRNTPGVTGFVGQGAKPSPLPRRDVEAFLMPKGGEEQVATRAKPRLEFELGETVRVKEGPFADFSGEVIEINEDQLRLKVLVNIFGRETPVELEFSKVAKL
jgi:transcriptional antiterminator NusG